MAPAAPAAPAAPIASVCGAPGRALRAWLCGLLLALGSGLPAAQAQRPAPGASAPSAGPAEPAASAAWRDPPYGPGVAARYPDPPQAPHTPALAPGRLGATRNEALHDWLAATAAMAAPGTRAALWQIGRSAGGVPIEALHLSRGEGRPRVLLIGQQHGNEPAGAEALLAIARELAAGGPGPAPPGGAAGLAMPASAPSPALASSPASSLPGADRAGVHEDALHRVLEVLDVVVLPRLNPDGARTGQRLNLQGLDINRDHLALRSPEARALALLALQQRPLLVIDAHEYQPGGRALQRFGHLLRPDLMLQHATTPNLPAAIGDWADRQLRQPVAAALAAAGHDVDLYMTVEAGSAGRELASGGLGAGLARNAFGLRHAASLLLESRGIGLQHWHLARRIESHRLALRAALSVAARSVAGLQRLQAEADAQVVAQACHGRLVVRAEPQASVREVVMVEPGSGRLQPVVVDWRSALQWQPVRERSRPCGYWLAADQTAAVQTLQLLGLQVRRLLTDAVLQAEAWHWPPGQDPAGHDAALQALAQPVAAGGYYVALDQPLANLAAAALEPDAPGSLLASGVIDRPGAVLRVMQRPQAVVSPSPAASLPSAAAGR